MNLVHLILILSSQTYGFTFWLVSYSVYSRKTWVQEGEETAKEGAGVAVA